MSENNGGFNAQDRMIFEYHDGTRKRFADPIELMVKLQSMINESDWKKFDKAREGFLSGQPNFEETKAFNECCLLVRNVFNLDKVGDDGQGNCTGTSDAEVMVIMAEFMAFNDELKKTENTNPTLLKYMELEELLSSNEMPPTETPTESVTEPTANSGSTAAGPVPAEPLKSPKEFETSSVQR